MSAVNGDAKTWLYQATHFHQKYYFGSLCVFNEIIITITPINQEWFFEALLKSIIEAFPHWYVVSWNQIKMDEKSFLQLILAKKLNVKIVLHFSCYKFSVKGKENQPIFLKNVEIAEKCICLHTSIFAYYWLGGNFLPKYDCFYIVYDQYIGSADNYW